jgi:hypothetical protein
MITYRQGSIERAIAVHHNEPEPVIILQQLGQRLQSIEQRTEASWIGANEHTSSKLDISQRE